MWRTVLRTEEGEWLISFTNPCAPKYVTDETLGIYKKCEPPQEYLQNLRNESHMSKAQKLRKDLIQPLLDDSVYIMDKKKRREMAEHLASNAGTTTKRILGLYYRYLSRHTLIEPKNKKKKENEKYKIFNWAINKYYFSAKKMSLKTTYEMMLLEKYTDENGNLIDQIPSWKSFRYFYYSNLYHRLSQKEISRDGLTSYQRNSRPLFGNANHWKNKLGYFQMDATVADVYLVSRFDRNTVVGRPYIYMAVDTVTELIAGIYVGFESNEYAVLACLANAAEDKVQYCARYGIEIKQEEWPAVGLPGGIITDQGREFISKRTEELCIKYDMEIEILPPFRPDEKSLVEKTFDLLQAKYISFFDKKGAIRKDAKERWAVDYASQATLNLYEYTKIVIYCTIFLNGGRILENYIPTKEMIQLGIPAVPKELWKWYEMKGLSDIVPVSSEDIYKFSLPRQKGTLTRKGISFNGFQYQSKDISKILQTIKKTSNITIAYDNEDIKKIYLVLNSEYIEFTLGTQYAHFFGLNRQEYEMIKTNRKTKQRELEYEHTKLSINTIRTIKDIIDSAKE